MNNYNNKYNGQASYSTNKSKSRNDDENRYADVDELIKKIQDNNDLKLGLGKILTVEEINLPNGFGYKIGRCFSKKKNDKSDEKYLNTNQLRKYFQQISSVKDIEGYKEQLKELYKVLPNIAYAVGRKVCPRKFYELMAVCISNKALLNEEDINAFVDFLTAVVAYSKLNSNN